ncbi:MAG: YiiX/YebB-like N1pC/P60 family cysteine hydrolase [Gammaproteobacteria bacterium]|nr:YiiX/YebB-like N1pC/P60 family cysteine hydrolase [Gammaproteobacteria bacterium]MDP2142112.1 YiiX/YebB-like N1pC/P60 family cysteine hydrolase [Gammaproteobacteria bacterium]MDP2348280.1 YiiX/YebB-like N1pC/P60 family cysteine hydrolase [Gammaproteobacteria bacterium]
MLKITRTLGRHLAAYLSKPLPDYERHDTASLEKFMRVIEPGDILLVDGNSRISTAIKYLTQSTWSHACMYMGSVDPSPDIPSLVEADLLDGVTLVPFSKYEHYNLRICRPVGLTREEKKRLLSFVEARLGYRYDLKNIIDLMRYLVQNPMVPPRFRRQLISLGSGEPTKAICSTLIAQAFQSINYPILPRPHPGTDAAEIEYRQRHFTHFVPRDFDLSPYFRVVKPTLEQGFDFRSVVWRLDPGAE